MVESLDKLNQICQKPNYKTAGNWMVRKILRPAALPITWVLLHTPVSANQVTLAALLIGLLGIFLTAGGSTNFLAGMLLIQFWYLLDHVDGQIARYRKTVSLSGRFFDFLMHQLIHGAFFFAQGWYVMTFEKNTLFALAGFIASIGVIGFNSLSDLKAKTFYEFLLTQNTVRIQKNTNPTSSASAANPSFLKRSFSLLHKLLEMHVLMNIYTLLALTAFFFSIDLRKQFLFFYVLNAILCFTAKSWHLIKNKKVDQEFNDHFQGI